MSHELNRENLVQSHVFHELSHKLTRHKCNIIGQAHELLAHII